MVTISVLSQHNYKLNCPEKIKLYPIINPKDKNFFCLEKNQKPTIDQPSILGQKKIISTIKSETKKESNNQTRNKNHFQLIPSETPHEKTLSDFRVIL